MFRLRELREKKNLTQTALAKDLKVSNTTISNWEAGYRQPDLETLIRIANYFDVSLDYLLGRNYKFRLYNQDKYVLRKEQLLPLLKKIVKVEDRHLPNIDGYIEALIALQENK